MSTEKVLLGSKNGSCMALLQNTLFGTFTFKSVVWDNSEKLDSVYGMLVWIQWTSRLGLQRGRKLDFSIAFAFLFNQGNYTILYETKKSG